MPAWYGREWRDSFPSVVSVLVFCRSGELVCRLASFGGGVGGDIDLLFDGVGLCQLLVRLIDAGRVDGDRVVLFGDPSVVRFVVKLPEFGDWWRWQRL